MKGIWFSRHEPTEAQIQDARRLGYELVGVEEGRRIGDRLIKSRADAADIVRELRTLAARHNARAVFGVWPVDLVHLFATDLRSAMGLHCFGAASLARSMEGGPPNFVHREWLLVGHLGRRCTMRR